MNNMKVETPTPSPRLPLDELGQIFDIRESIEEKKGERNE